MGCFNDLDNDSDNDCYKNEECSEHKPNPKAHFCCCAGDMCNAQFRWAPHPEEPTTPRPPPPPPPRSTRSWSPSTAWDGVASQVVLGRKLIDF